MSKLNGDILFLLFSKELQDDSKSLFSCLMVNRLWCETIIPILWNDPWRYCYKESSLYDIINYYLVNDTDTKVKEFLTSQEVKLPQISHKSLLFDYLSFCKSINVNVIDSIISFGYYSDYSKFLLKQEFYNILIRKCSELKYLDVRSIEHQTFYFSEAKVCLESLCELKFNTSIDPSFIYGLARICQNIQRLVIDNVTMKKNYGIFKLIEVQNNLKYFEWNDNFINDSDLNVYGYFNYEKSFYALIQNADTLNHLIIHFHYIEDYEHEFLKEVLPKLHKLKTLKTRTFYLSSKEIPLIYHDIEVFNIDCVTIETATRIIENSRGCLREILFLQEPYYYDDCYYDYRGDIENHSLLLRKIYENCPLVEYLSLICLPLKEYFTEFKKLLGVCQNLKSLLLLVVEETNESYKNGENLLEILAESAPTNLRELRFNFKVSLETLEIFLEKWKGRPALFMLTDNSVYTKKDYKNLINKYKHVGVIEDFRFSYVCYYSI